MKFEIEETIARGMILAKVKLEKRDEKENIIYSSRKIARFEAQAEAKKINDEEYIGIYRRDASIIEIEEKTIKPVDEYDFKIITCFGEKENIHDLKIIDIIEVLDEHLVENI